jgi:hypothetical protein
LIEGVVLDDPGKFEAEFDRCVRAAGRALKTRTTKVAASIEGGAA